MFVFMLALEKSTLASGGFCRTLTEGWESAPMYQWLAAGVELHKKPAVKSERQRQSTNSQ